jgi:DNA-binding MarR family transcriptional regulator
VSEAKLPSRGKGGGARPSVELAETAAAVRRGVAAMTRRLRGLREDHGVSPAKLSLLGRLVRAGRPLPAAEIARLERLQPQSLTRIIADLEALGLVQRSRSEADRRELLIEIAPTGRALLARDAERQSAWLARVLAARTTPSERGLLHLAARLLEDLAEAD